MQSGGNPKNIAAIYDSYDDANSGFVDYSNWNNFQVTSIRWDGGGDGATWEDPFNWDPDRLPGIADDVIIPAVGDNITVVSDTTVFRLTIEEGAAPCSLFVTDTLGATDGMTNSGYLYVGEDAALEILDGSALTNDSLGTIVLAGGHVIGDGSFLTDGRVEKIDPGALPTTSTIKLAFSNLFEDPGDGFLVVNEGILVFEDAFVNAGSVLIKLPAELKLDPGDGFLTTSGRFVIDDGATLDIPGSGTTLRNLIGGEFILEGGDVTGAGVLENLGTMIKRNGGAPSTSIIQTRVSNLFDDPGDGFLTVGEGILSIQGEFLNEGTVNVDSGAVLEIAPPSALLKATRGAGSPGVTAPGTAASGAAASGAATNDPDGRFTVAGSTYVRSLASLTNDGLVTITSTGAIVNEGTFLHQENGVLAGTGTFDNTTGSFTGDGAIRPGSDIGVLDFVGPFSQGATSEIEIEIGGTVAGIDYDQVMINGPTTLDGAIYVTLVNGFMPQEGDSFSVITIAPGATKTSTMFECFGGLDAPGGITLYPVEGPNVLAFVARDTVTGNASPVAVDDFDSTNAASAITIPLLANDTDADVEPLRIASLIKTGLTGKARINPGDTTITYTPLLAFTGRDTLRYTVTDCAGGTDSALVVIGVARGPAIWSVPGDAPTIAGGLALAWPGDTVEVAAGTYNENAIAMQPGVTLRGATGDPRDVNLDAGGADRHFLAVTIDSTASIESMTLRNGSAVNGGAILSFSSTMRIENCIITQCTASGSGGGIHASNAGPIITGTLFHGNKAATGGSISLASADARITNCTFVNDTVTVSGAALQVENSSPLVDRSILAFNHGSEAVSCTSASPLFTCTDIYGNAGGNWTGCIAGQSGVSNNLTVDPFFCQLSAPTDPYSIEASSPFAKPENLPCGLIGARPAGCAIVDVTAPGSVPLTYRLDANRPNPFNPTTTIRFALPRAGHARLEIYAVSGRRVAVLVDAGLDAGEYDALWHGRDTRGRPVASGIYFARFTVADFTTVRKMVLVR